MLIPAVELGIMDLTNAASPDDIAAAATGGVIFAADADEGAAAPTEGDALALLPLPVLLPEALPDVPPDAPAADPCDAATSASMSCRI